MRAPGLQNFRKTYYNFNKFYNLKQNTENI